MQIFWHGGRLAWLAALIWLSAAQIGSAQSPSTLKKVTMVDGNSTMILGTPEEYVPSALGYWREEGYDVQFLHAQGSAAAVQMMIGGSADFINANTAPYIIGNTKGVSDIRAAAIVLNSVWRILTLKESGLTKIEDLRGKAIGIPNVGTGGNFYIDNYLLKNGMNPERDIRRIVIGTGPGALQALKSGAVQAFLDFRPDFARMEVLNGAEFNYLYDPDWLKHPDYGLATPHKLVQSNPAMVEAIGRGFVKGMIFQMASPICTAKIYRKLYDPQGKSPISIEDEAKLVATRVSDMKIAFEFAGAQYWGNASIPGFDNLQNFLLAAKLITQKLPSEQQVVDIPDYAKKINDFSIAKIKEQAERCEGF